jgi:hypothetical protein
MVGCTPLFVFGLRREKVVGGGRKQHNEKFSQILLSKNVTREVKSRRV